MTFQDIIEYCSKKENALLVLPFGETPICFKVNKRLFCELFVMDDDIKITVRCAPELAILLRDKYNADIVRGYHCPPAQQPYKNTIRINSSVPDAEVFKMIDHSYEEAKSRK